MDTKKGLDIVIPAVDGFPLHATLFTPEIEPGSERPVIETAVVISSATAVLRQFYAPFAEYLATSFKCAVITYDYRGVGDSFPPSSVQNNKQHPLVDFEATITDWGFLDLPAILDYMHSAYPELPLAYIGHSVGAHLVPLAPNGHLVTRNIFISSNNAYYGYRPGYKSIFQMKYMSPLLMRWYGYFPGKKYGGMEDLPIGVMKEWSTWSEHPRYFCDVNPEWKEKFDRFRKPILGISFTDDAYATEKAFTSLLEFFTGSDVVHWRFKPQDIGLNSVGHMGFFFGRYQEIRNNLWAPVIQFICNNVIPPKPTSQLQAKL
ncbi:hypothetical protein K7432_002170 [Basidiobolus ranarum]|uniref:AB hydrolase-1 domain-containing protein n=1 Tax=Basidiobolus ranarum TaxID=34480 RepID=A0ABR2W8I1_9FUNG